MAGRARRPSGAASTAGSRLAPSRNRTTTAPRTSRSRRQPTRRGGMATRQAAAKPRLGGVSNHPPSPMRYATAARVTPRSAPPGSPRAGRSRDRADWLPERQRRPARDIEPLESEPSPQRTSGGNREVNAGGAHAPSRWSRVARVKGSRGAARRRLPAALVRSPGPDAPGSRRLDRRCLRWLALFARSTSSSASPGPATRRDRTLRSPPAPAA
jgi:hypothetical protein